MCFGFPKTENHSAVGIIYLILWRTEMFIGSNGYADLDDFDFTNTKLKPLHLLCNFMNTKYEYKTVLVKQIENANTWQTGLISFIGKVQRFFEVRRLNQWRTLSIS